MNNILLVSKIILGVFITILIIVPFIGQHCGNMNNMVTSAPMCHMHVFQQSEINFEQIRHLMIAIFNNPNYYLSLILVVIIAGMLSIIIDRRLFNKINFVISTAHMKPWDPLRFAFAQGLIHNKHYY